MTVVVAALGGGGLAALLRARTQNRVDEHVQLNAEQQAFRQSMAEQWAAVRAQLVEVEKRNDALETETRDQGKQLAALTTRNEYQEKQIAQQSGQIADLRTQNAQQAVQIAALTEEKAALNQRVLIAESQRSFLERENGELRREVQRLQIALPRRTETE